MSEVRFALCHAVRTLGRPVAGASPVSSASAARPPTSGSTSSTPSAAAAPPPAPPPRRWTTGHAARRAPPAGPPDDVERRVLAVRDRYRWGPRKIRAFLLQEAGRRGEPPPALPSVRTCGAILARHGRVPDPAPPPPALQRFERPAPNQLWQVDHKGPFEVARRPVTPLTVIDDHSRYCLAFRRTPDKTMAAAFAVLWDVFADAGLPEAVLCDNAFNAPGRRRPGPELVRRPRLVRLGIRPAHGRPYHPQTQGKCERFHATAERELVFFNARRDADEHFDADGEAWRAVYNALRPHEALGDQPPASRWVPSPRKRPAVLPAVAYDAGATVRRIGSCGEVSFKGYTILVGRGLAGDPVRVEERGSELCVFYCWKQVRSLSPEQLVKGRML